MTRTNPKPATCEKCGSSDVTWFRSKRTGHYYLCEIFVDDEGDKVSSSRDFHSKYCGDAEAHDKRQDELTGKKPKPILAGDALDRATEISSLSVFDRVLAIADLSRENRMLALQVAQVWSSQGETTLVEIINGALGLTQAD